jgi:hypothetical protein
MKIELGKRYKDSISGFVGIAVARTEWLHGCERITLQPTTDKDGKMMDTASFDAPQLIDIEQPLARVETPRAGGPRPEPDRGR